MQMRRADIPGLVARPAGFFAVALAAFFALDRGIAHGLNRLAERSQHRFTKIYNPETGDAGPVVVLGHSRGVGLIDPAAFQAATGAPVFNLAANGMSSELAEAIFLDYRERHPKPAGLIIEVTSLCSNNNLIRDLKAVAHRSARLTTLMREEDPAIYWATRLFGTYRYNGDLMPRMLVYQKRDDQALINKFRATESFLDSVTLNARDYPIIERNVAALGRLVAGAKADGIPVRLVMSPFWPHFIEKSEVPAQITAAAEGATGERVWDFSRSIADPSAFADHVHLNTSGTARLHALMSAARLFDGIGGGEHLDSPP